MPDSIGDEKVLKRPLEKNKEFVKKLEKILLKQQKENYRKKQEQ